MMPNFIEIETSTYCNRRCSFCPNSIYERGIEQRLIDKHLFKKIILDLKSLEYEGTIALHNYNEPLFDPFLYEHLQTLSDNIPHSKKIILTNGDILTREKLTNLDSLGVNQIRIALYSWVQNPIETINKHARNLGLNAQLAATNDGTVSRLVFNRMEVAYLVPNRDLFTSRGGLLEKKICSEYCYLPLVSSAIDIDGNMKICCEIYPANEVHQKYGIVGNLRDKSFWDLWFSTEYNKLRADLLKNDKKNKICRECTKIPKSSLKVTSDIIDKWKELLKDEHLFN